MRSRSLFVPLAIAPAVMAQLLESDNSGIYRRSDLKDVIPIEPDWVNLLNDTSTEDSSTIWAEMQRDLATANLAKRNQPNDFHHGITANEVCWYLKGLSYKAQELQRPVWQFEYENVPWLIENKGPYAYVIEGMRQVEWIFYKLQKLLENSSSFIDWEERQIVSCYFRFSGSVINYRNERFFQPGDPFKRLLWLIRDKGPVAKYEPYCQHRVQNTLKNLEESYKLLALRLIERLSDSTRKGYIYWDLGNPANASTSASYTVLKAFNTAELAYEIK